MMNTRNSIGLWSGIAAYLVYAIFLGSAQPLNASERAVTGSAANRPAVLLAFAAAPQIEEAELDHSTEEPGAGEAEHHSLRNEVFHWLNFLLLVGGLGYLVKKFLLPFLEERGKKIREDMDRSAKALADADQRLSVVEARMKSMDEAMASLRQAALHESAAERERIEQSAAADAGKVLAMAEQEIDAAVKTARQELRVFTSELALGLAEKNIRASLTPTSEQRILRNFLQQLSAGDTNGHGQKAAAPSQRKQE